MEVFITIGRKFLNRHYLFIGQDVVPITRDLIREITEHGQYFITVFNI